MDVMMSGSAAASLEIGAQSSIQKLNIAGVHNGFLIEGLAITIGLPFWIPDQA